MVLSFELTVHALAQSLVRERCAAAGRGVAVDEAAVGRFLIAQHAGMPDYLRLPFRILTLVFDASGILRGGRPFHRLPHDARWRQIRAWKGSATGTRRSFVKFFETLTVFGTYSDAYPNDTLPAAVAAQAAKEHGLENA